jgi:hypothetical protein
MYAVLVTAQIEPGREAEGEGRLHSEVVPAVRQVPGVVAAYWLEPVNGEGFSIVVFEDEQSARAAAERIGDIPRPDFVSLGEPDLRRVVANV